MTYDLRLTYCRKRWSPHPVGGASLRLLLVHCRAIQMICQGMCAKARESVGLASPPPQPLPRHLGHDAKDGVVAADAGSDLLVVFLGVTHLVELGLVGQTGRGLGPATIFLDFRVRAQLRRGYLRWTPAWTLRTKPRSAACDA